MIETYCGLQISLLPHFLPSRMIIEIDLLLNSTYFISQIMHLAETTFMVTQKKAFLHQLLNHADSQHHLIKGSYYENGEITLLLMPTCYAIALLLEILHYKDPLVKIAVNGGVLDVPLNEEVARLKIKKVNGPLLLQFFVNYVA